MIAAAGITQSPVQQFEAGTWNRDALDDFLTKMKATGKRGLVLAGEWGVLAVVDDYLRGYHLRREQQGGLRHRPEVHGDLGVAVPAHQGRDHHLRRLAAQGPGHRRPVLRSAAGQLSDGPLDLAEPEEVEVRLRHRALSVRGRQVVRAGQHPGRGHGRECQGQGSGRGAVVDHPVRERRGPEGSTRRWWQRCAVHPRRRRRSSPRGTCRNTPPTGTRWPRSVTRSPLGIASKPAVATNINAEIDKVVKSGADAQTFATKICAFINGG